MKILLTIVVLLLPLSALAEAVYVQPYTLSDGTYIPGYYKTSPNKTKLDNWSTKGNTNPYTGKPGYQNPELLVSKESAPKQK